MPHFIMYSNGNRPPYFLKGVSVILLLLGNHNQNGTHSDSVKIFQYCFFINKQLNIILFKYLFLTTNFYHVHRMLDLVDVSLFRS